jgi:hypothetical protein
MDESKLYSQIKALPDDLKKEVENFVQFLMYKSQKKTPIKALRGKWKGMIKMSPDFDEPLDDFKEYME